MESTVDQSSIPIKMEEGEGPAKIPRTKSPKRRARRVQIEPPPNPEPEETVTSPHVPDHPSRIPLADESGRPGKSPAELLQEAQEEERRREELERRRRVSRQVREDITPTPAQIKASIAAKIGEQEAQKARQRMNKEVTESQKQKLDQDYIKTAEQFDELKQDLIEKCRRLNEYRDHYEGKIRYEFRPHYHPDMRGGRALIESELYNVKLLLNSRDLPSGIKQFIVYIAKGMETFLVSYFDAPLGGIGNDVQLEMDAGFFDSEIEQLAIEWAGWLQMPPSKRLLAKLAYIIGRRTMYTISTRAGLPTGSNPNGEVNSASFLSSPMGCCTVAKRDSLA